MAGKRMTVKPNRWSGWKPEHTVEVELIDRHTQLGKSTYTVYLNGNQIGWVDGYAARPHRSGASWAHHAGTGTYDPTCWRLHLLDSRRQAIESLVERALREQGQSSVVSATAVCQYTPTPASNSPRGHDMSSTTRKRPERPLTTRQQHALFVVIQNEPATAAEIARHLLWSSPAARGIADALERRGLVGRQYTGVGTGSGHAYVATAAGRDLLETLDNPEEGDEQWEADQAMWNRMTQRRRGRAARNIRYLVGSANDPDPANGAARSAVEQAVTLALSVAGVRDDDERAFHTARDLVQDFIDRGTILGAELLDKLIRRSDNSAADIGALLGQLHHLRQQQVELDADRGWTTTPTHPGATS